MRIAPMVGQQLAYHDSAILLYKQRLSWRFRIHVTRLQVRSSICS